MATINTKQPGDCGYMAFYSRQQIELYAPSLYEAKQQAVKHFRPAKSKEHMVHVYLAETSDGTPVDQTL